MITRREDLPKDISIITRIRLLQFLPPGCFELTIRNGSHGSVIYEPIVFINGVVPYGDDWCLCHDGGILKGLKGEVLLLSDIIEVLRVATKFRTFPSGKLKVREYK